MKHQKLVIIISGTPGTGKTSVARELKEWYSALHINLTDLAIENNLIIKNDVDRETKIVDLGKLIPFLENLIKSHSSNIIIEGHYADIVPDSLISIIIILRTNPHVLERRLKEKQFSFSKIQENLQSEILGSCTSAALETHKRKKIYEVDNSNISVQKTVKLIQIFIEKKPPSNVGKINWMHKLEENNELLKYFP
ncbi:MAG: adenylate kinase family protein [Promethearchaeota archaeon]